MYNVKRCIYPSRDSKFRNGWLIIHPDFYLFWTNKYLHHLSLKSSNTAQQYAYKLCKFFNYLETYHSIDYRFANEYHLQKFISFIKYGEKPTSIQLFESRVSGFTIQSYISVFKSFYTYLYNNNRPLSLIIKKHKGTENKYRFLYGNIWKDHKVALIVDNSYNNSKLPREYEKWYSPDQQEAILSHFNTNRDKAIFSISCDGLRIDEILSAQLEFYNSKQGTLQLSRSKGKTPEDSKRICTLSSRSLTYLENYLINERTPVEIKAFKSGRIISGEIFINLKERRDTLGLPVKYHNVLEIIKRAAKGAGFDPSHIRTHSGRSTKAGELFREQVKNPGSLSDYQICDIMGWKRIESAEPYKNRQDPEIIKENKKVLDKNWNTKND